MQNQPKNSLIKELVSEMQQGGYNPNVPMMHPGMDPQMMQQPMMQQPMQPMMQQPMMRQPMMQQPMRMDEMDNGAMESMAPVGDMEVEMEDLEEEDKSFVDRVIDMLRDPVVIAVLFVLLNLPQVNRLIVQFIPMVGNNMYYNLIFKGLLLGFLFRLVKQLL